MDSFRPGGGRLVRFNRLGNRFFDKALLRLSEIERAEAACGEILAKEETINVS
jgi:hypothetical protein